jgi:diguanylate cyclase (GGDEF)-like protein/PAS domain S-box-containing protein
MASRDQSSLVSDAAESEDFYKRVLDNLYDAVYFTDLQRRITYWNRAAELLTGFSAQETVGSCCADNILMHVNEAGTCLCTGQCPLSCSMRDRRPRQMEIYLRHKDGHRIPVSVRSCPLVGKDGVVIGAVEIFNDNSRHKAAQEQVKDLSKLAFLDPVTQVANRRYSEQKFIQYLDQYERYGTSFAVLMVDLDEFKQINDTYGHSAGDAVLIAVAKTLSGCLRTSDLLGRWGGDEFIALMPGMTGAHLPEKAELCRALVERSDVPIQETRVSTTVSIGAAVVEPGDTVESLLKRADTRMYESKQAGRNRVSLSLR